VCWRVLSLATKVHESMGARDHLSKLRWRRRKPTETWVGGNHVHLMTAGDVAFTRMLEVIDAAQRSVWLEMYWFAADQVGLRFFRALTAALERGVQVVVLYDAWGSFATPRQFFEDLRSKGAVVGEFNPISLLQQKFRLASLTRRNHRKLLIVDGRVAFTGGQNIADQWNTLENGELWRDEVVEVCGPVVRVLEEAFLDSWSVQRDLGQRKYIEPLALPPVHPPQALPEGVNVAVLTQSGLRQKRFALRAYLQRLRAATRSIRIANAYFVPNPAIVRSLTEAAKRGVDVTIIVAGKSDVPLVAVASRAVWLKLLRAGIRLFEWRKSVLHSKLAIVDDVWVTAGSFNLDYLSLRRNRELNLAIENPEFARTVNGEFESMVRASEEVVLEQFQRRSRALRFLERTVYAFRTWL
jgi:cardiolipin synthase